MLHGSDFRRNEPQGRAQKIPLIKNVYPEAAFVFERIRKINLALALQFFRLLFG